MKKLIFGFIAMLLVLGVQAQDVKKMLKEPKKAFSAYRVDNAKKDQMKVAVDKIEEIVGMDVPAELKADVYLLRGDIYNEIANQINNSKTLGLNTAEGLPDVKHPEVLAFKSYKMALDNQVKKFHANKSLEGLRAVQNYLSEMGIQAYTSQDYAGAFTAFQNMLDADAILKENGQESALSSDEMVNNQYYLTGLAAFSSGKKSVAKEYFTKLYNDGTKEPAVYEYLYKMESEDSNPEAAYKYLEEGRKKFPDEISLLFAEINHFLQLGKSDELIDKIQQAIEAEPENVSLYNVLGNTYDGLNQAAAKEGDIEKANEYLELAFGQFKKAFEIDPKNTTAVYSMGQLFYNRAAVKTQDLQKYASDYSKEGMKKYEEAREAVFEEFNKALPFFQKSESLNPNDNNTL
ncbi:MAG: hypothetical protein AAFO07_33050, partial [Bacteroidota bacterium]